MRTPGKFGIGNQCHSIYDNTGAEVCRVHENLDDRFFIVTACNAHEELVAALKLARTHLAEYKHAIIDATGETVGERIDKALSAAKATS